RSAIPRAPPSFPTRRSSDLFGSIRILSPLEPEVVIDNLRRSDHDVIVPEELKEFGVTDLSAEVKGSNFELHWIADTSRFVNQRCRGFVRAVGNGSRISARFTAGPIDFLLIAYLPLAAIVGVVVGRTRWYWLALAGVSVALMLIAKRNRGAEPKRARLI